MIARRWRFGGLILVSLVVGLIAARRFSRDEQLQIYFTWQAAYSTLQQQPSAYGFELHAKPQSAKDFMFDCMVYQDGSAAFQETIGNEITGGRSRVIQPFNGRPRLFRDEADGSVTDVPFRTGFSRIHPPRDSWEVGNPIVNGEQHDPPLWTFLTDPLLDMHLRMHQLTWDSFRSIPVRRIEDTASGNLQFELSTGTYSLLLQLDPTREHRLVRVETTDLRRKRIANYKLLVTEVLDWQQVPDGRWVPRDTTFVYANQEWSVRIVNPTLGPIDPAKFDVTPFENRLRPNQQSLEFDPDFPETSF